ncbi:MAG: single-stranded-DNA-specific exonuclease RecJ [Deltaproteobacteria bacterium]|nr:single-stranded-DNA-specific exonuclease RecJ [Deltaproteobacteria bacterium]
MQTGREEARTRKRWRLNPVNRELRETLGRELNILPLTAQLLVNRGLVDCGKASSFLKPSLTDLHDPFLLKGMDKAVERIARALDAGEKIAVYGDYDVDGTTSTALLCLFFRELGVDAGWYIPERQAEGYGLNEAALKKLHAAGVKLVITVDCGASNEAEVECASSLGIDVIVTDHHEMPPEPPRACAIINPKQEGCAFPFKGLAGVGVAFNLVMALRSRLRETGWFKGSVPNLKKYLDLVAIGTVADMVPLVDENRVLVAHGLRELDRTSNLGLKALKDSVFLKPGRITAENIAYQIAPRINAAGRVARASMALRLLISESGKEAAELAFVLNRENSSRQKIEGETLKQALDMLGDGAPGKGIVLAFEGWHSGVIGIVASRLVERFSRPVVMIALDGETGKGSARGVKAFNILKGLSACSPLLEKYGGHKAAAGLTIARQNIEGFRAGFMQYLDDTVDEKDLAPEITLDAVVSLEEVDNRLIEEIESLSPFGVSNREPLLCLVDADIVQTEVVGARHLRFKVSQNGCSRSGIGFGLAAMHPVQGAGYGVAFSPYMDEFQGARNLRLRIKDIRPECVNFLT